MSEKLRSLFQTSGLWFFIGLILAGLIFLLAPGLGSFGEDLMSPLFSPLFIDRLPRLLLY